MLKTDPLSFLDEYTEAEEPAQIGSDPLSFLGEDEEPEQPFSKSRSKNYAAGDDDESDPLAFLDQPEEPQKPVQEEPSIFQRAKNYFTSGKLGEAAAFQMKSGGFSGAPTATPKQAKRIATEAATIAAVEAAFVPVIGAAEASAIAPKILTALARLTQAGTTGATTATTVKLVEEGQLPSQEELLENGLEWMAIDAAMQGLHLTASGGKTAYDFGKAVSTIAKEEKIPASQVLKKLWESTKNYIKSKFGKVIEKPVDITPKDVEVLIDNTKKAEESGLDNVVKPEEVEIETKPISEERPKVTEEIKIPEIKSESSQKLAQPESKPKDTVKEAKKPLEIEQKPKVEKPEVKEETAPVLEVGKVSENLPKPEKRPVAYGDEHYSAEIFDNVFEVFKVPKRGYLIRHAPTKLALVTVPTKKEAIDFLHTIYERKAFDKSKVLSSDVEVAKKAFDQEKITPIIDEIRNREFSEKQPKEKVPPTNGARVEKPIKQENVIDERPILKEILDLKEELAATKGTTNAIIRKKNELSEEIKNKSKELVEARKQNKTVEKPYEKKFGKPDLTTKGLREQKQFILDKVDEALENPPDTNQITIDVPGDGLFKINNVPKSLENFRERVEKGWPTVGIKVAKEKGEPALMSKASGERESGEELPKKQTQTPPPQTQSRQPVVGKKQAVARSKIIELFRTAFTDPIRLGKFKQRALGIHKLWPKVTRLLKANDVETAAHEIGHNLHTTLYGGDAKTGHEQARNIERALAPYLNELKPLAHYEPWGMEGFAEFTRLFVTNPDVAEDLAPNFYTKFENDLRAEYPEMLNALLEAREYYNAYLQGTPQSRIRAQTNYANDKGKLANIIDSVKKKLNPDFLKTEFLDDVFPAKRLVAEAFGIPLSEVENLKDERNLYRSLRVLKGAVGKGDVFVLHETFDPKTLDKVNGSLRDILKQLPNEEAYREFNDYLIARRSLEKISQDIETGIHLGDAVAVETDLRPKYGKLAQELDKYNDTLLKYAENSGLISAKQYKMIKDNNVLYVPFQRVMEPEKGGVASGAGKLQAGKPIKRMKGSSRDIIAPIESVLKNTYSIIINAEKNLAGQTLASIAKMKNMGTYVEAIPTPIKLKGKIEGEQVARELAKRFENEGLADLIEYDQNGKVALRQDIADAIPEVFLRFGAGQYPAGENIVTVYVEGKPKYYEVSPEIFEMWTKGIAPYTANLITKILRIPARTLRAGAILNPKFIQKNFIRDTWGSWLFTKYGKSIKDPKGLFIDTLYSPLAMLATSARQRKLYVEWMKSGGSMSTMQSLDRDSVVKKLNEVRGKWQGIQPIKWLRQAAEISEEINRLSEFGKALAVEGKTRLGREIAAFASRDLSIDFAKMGLQTKALNQIIPFWNATVQGGDKLLRTLANPEDRKNFLPRILGFIIIPSLILAWLNKDDENVKEFYEEEKDFNFITNINGQYVKIPVPFETGVLVHGMTQRMFNYFMNKDPEAFEKFMGSILQAMMPNFIPAFANPFIEAYANKNFFTDARIIPRAQEDLISRYQYKNNTSNTARLLGRCMAYMLGQETRSKAASPAIIDHFINSWGGGLGRLMINISDASLEAAGLSDKIPGVQQSILERSGFDAFSARFPRASTRSIEKFYDNYADATARKKSFKYAEKMDIESGESQEQAYQRFEKIYDYNTLQMAYKSMQSCQKEINNISNDPSIEQDLKKQMIDDLYLQMIDFAKAANEDIRQYRLIQ